MNLLMKRIFVLVIASVTIFSMSAKAFAQDGGPQTKPKVIIAETASPVPNNVIQDILNEYPDAGLITITGFETGGVRTHSTANQIIALSGGYSFTNVTKTQTQSGVLAQTSFIISIAKGQTASIGSNWSASLFCNITGKIDSSSLGITGSITSGYSASQTFSGPPESRSNNTRSYYINFYENKGTYAATCHDSTLGTTITYPISGAYTEPTYYVSYSVDSVAK